jgi:hypothetical protein
LSIRSNLFIYPRKVDLTKLTRILLLGILILVLGLPALAQSGRRTITGIVRDPSGAVVPGVEITITEKDTGAVTRTVPTDVVVPGWPFSP